MTEVLEIVFSALVVAGDCVLETVAVDCVLATKLTMSNPLHV